jgi:hypothetical protein
MTETVISKKSKPVKSEQNRIVSESKNIVIPEKINDESDEYNIIHISIGVIIITFLLYFLFKR